MTADQADSRQESNENGDLAEAKEEGKVEKSARKPKMSAEDKKEKAEREKRTLVRRLRSQGELC